MIVRLLALDPQPEAGRSDILCYQVPEHSREYRLLVSLFELYRIEYTTLMSTPRKARPKAQGMKE